jgi:hypothetical protein
MNDHRNMIEIRGARTHNLRNIDVEIPLHKCTVVVGPSGSGKSSLAFGTVHAAAHAAFLEGISSYARFTETRLATPDVDFIHGLRPTIALAQGYGHRSSRSTVGTVTDALSLMRLLFSRLGHPESGGGCESLLPLRSSRGKQMPGGNELDSGEYLSPDSRHPDCVGVLPTRASYQRPEWSDPNTNTLRSSSTDPAAEAGAPG